MPKFNGVVSYPIEVLLHLLWCYVCFSLVYAGLTIPFTAAAAFGGHLGEALAAWVALFAGNALFFLACVHALTCLMFRSYFVPRFPYAPPLLTFALAALFGSVIVSVAAGADSYVADAAALSQWWDGHRSYVLTWFLGAQIGASAAGLFGWLIYSLGGQAAAMSGVGRWLGWLIVGRAAFDAYVEREASQLQKEYDGYASRLRP